MLDFPEKIYDKILSLAIKHNFISHCREYPFFTLEQKLIPASAVRRISDGNFKKQNFSCGLYIHFPFCKSRCAFCKYYAENCFSPKIIDEYLWALNREIELYGIDFSDIILSNIYFGGGTPTLFSPNQIERLKNIIYKFFRFDEKTQISVEGTPESINSDNLKEWRELGINRISLGCQSFNDDILKRVGRRHSVKTVFEAFDVIRKIGIKYTGIDVIFGLSGETLKTYENTVQSAIKLSPDFIECFLFTPGGRTKMKRFHPIGSDLDSVIRFFKESLTANGYRLYFSGNFLGFVKKSVIGTKAMNQNTEEVYNQRASCMGLGPSSISQFPQIRYRTASSVADYIKRIKKGLLPLHYGVFAKSDDLKRQYVISRIGYYRNLPKKDYFNLFNVPIEHDFLRELQYLKRTGIVSETKNNFIWHFNESEMGHRDFFLHVLRYWYAPRYIRKIAKQFEIS